MDIDIDSLDREQTIKLLAQLFAKLLGDKPSADGDRLMTIDEAAKLLGVSKGWLYRRAKRLGLAVKLGDGTLRVSANALQAYMRERRTGRRA